MAVAKIEPLTQARSLRGPFDYRLPASMVHAAVGSLCVVPFGRRRVTGVVVGRSQASEVAPERLLEPLELLDDAIPADLVDVAQWVADEYCSTPARALALVLPPGTAAGRHRRGRPVTSSVAAATAAGQLALDREERLGPRQRAVLELLDRNGSVPLADVLDRAGCDRATITRLIRRGLIVLSPAARVAPTSSSRQPRHSELPALTRAQRECADALIAALDRRSEGEGFLLHGVTASGKTEVYLRAASAALSRGRGVIVLVPEIALCAQTVRRFEQRFADEVAVVHSRMTAHKRREQWRRLRAGEARVCVGARSAVFAPVLNLGCVIVDEEHDSSYKQEQDPRYDAREVAERRAREAQGLLVLGSATPRPESYERLRRLRLAHRIDGRRMPEVEAVSMAGATAALHPRTREALDDVRRRAEKAIICINRRGWSNFLSCRSCGRVWSCPDCDVSLVLHRFEGKISCHHCGHWQQTPRTCPDCGSVSLARHGLGTERLESELEALMAPLPVTRLDSDTATRALTASDPLARFSSQPAGVLVGTQMVAKGHDFPEVTLACVIDADATLRFPDFRAEERTFSLVCQLAGRSGRGQSFGRVIVQALDPDARALSYACAHDSEGFVTSELERRRVLSYPPFSHLIRVVTSCSSSGPELEAAEAIRNRLDGELGVASAHDRASVLGPAPLFRLRGRWRAQVVVKAPQRSIAVASVRHAVAAQARAKNSRTVAFSVDVDPQ